MYTSDPCLDLSTLLTFIRGIHSFLTVFVYLLVLRTLLLTMFWNDRSSSALLWSWRHPFGTVALCVHWDDVAVSWFLRLIVSGSLWQMASELHGMLAGNVSMVTGENMKPSYGGEHNSFLTYVVTPIYDVISGVCLHQLSSYFESCNFYRVMTCSNLRPGFIVQARRCFQ